MSVVVTLFGKEPDKIRKIVNENAMFPNSVMTDSQYMGSAVDCVISPPNKFSSTADLAVYGNPLNNNKLVTNIIDSLGAAVNNPRSWFVDLVPYFLYSKSFV